MSDISFEIGHLLGGIITPVNADEGIKSIDSLRKCISLVDKDKNDNRFGYSFGEKVTPTWDYEDCTHLYNIEEFGYLVGKSLII